MQINSEPFRLQTCLLDEGTGGGEHIYFLDVKLQATVRYIITLITVGGKEETLPPSHRLIGSKRAKPRKEILTCI